MGGVWTLHRHLADGLKQIGHDVDEYLIPLHRSQKEFSWNRADVGTEINQLKPLGFRSALMLQEYKQTMEKYDVVIFTNPCPHITKSYKDKSWQQCYDINAFKIAIFHEPLAEGHYPWIKDVPIDHAVAVQPKAWLSTEILDRRIPRSMIRHPMELDDMLEVSEEVLEAKKKECICPHQFRSWKRMDDVIRAIPLCERPIHVFGKGTEYYYMRRASYPYRDEGKKSTKSTLFLRECLESDKSKETIRKIAEKFGITASVWSQYKRYLPSLWKDAVESGNLQYHGFATREELIKCFKQCTGVIDISSIEHIREIKKDYDKFYAMNYSSLEGMKYSCVPFLSRYAYLEPFTNKNVVEIPEQSLSINLAHEIGKFDFDNCLEMLIENQRLLRFYFDKKVVAQQYMDLVDGRVFASFGVHRKTGDLSKWF